MMELPKRMIWEKLIECKNEIIKTFDERAEEFEEPGLDHFNTDDGGWINLCGVMAVS